MAVLVKDPDAVLDYAMDWSDYLEAGEVIADSQWVTLPADGLPPSGASVDGAVAQVTLGGGVTRTVHVVTNRITTSLGRSDDRSLTIYVQER